MKNTGIPYEQLTQKIFQQILNNNLNEVTTINVQHNITIKGKTTSHQIDVYWEYEIGGIVYHTIVQARDYSSAIKQNDILAFRAILDDLPHQPRGVFVTKTGYQKGAKQVASANGILLYELREAGNKDWENRIKTIEIEMSVRVPSLKEFKLNIDRNWIVENFKNPDSTSDLLEKHQMAGMANEIVFYTEDFIPIIDMHTLTSKYINIDDPTNIDLPIKHIFEKESFLKTDIPELPLIKIHSVQFTIIYDEIKQKTILGGEDIVIFILRNTLKGTESVFDDKLQLKNGLNKG